MADPKKTRPPKSFPILIQICSFCKSALYQKRSGLGPVNLASCNCVEYNSYKQQAVRHILASAKALITNSAPSSLVY